MLTGERLQSFRQTELQRTVLYVFFFSFHICA